MKKKNPYEVPVQQGKIISNPPTMKQMPYPERVTERRQEQKKTRWGQHTDLETPRKGKR